MDAQSKNLDADFSKPRFKGNDTDSVPSTVVTPSAAPANNANVSKPPSAQDRDKFEKKIKKQEEVEIALGAIAGTSVAGLALTWAKLGKILKVLGVAAIPLALFGKFGRISKVGEFSLKDGLTGLFNKSTLLTTLSKDFQKTVKKKENYSVAMLDMDNFKAFNEIFDHDTGDKVLKTISDCIQRVVKTHKVKGFRYGGEEFAVILPGHNSKSAEKILEEMSNAIKKDEYIQGLLPEFSKKAQEDIAFVSPKLIQINEIFAKLREKSNNPRKLADEIISLAEEHIKEYEPTDAKALKDFVAKLKTASGGELHKNLHISTKVGLDSSLGNELDKIYRQYSSMKHDREKWLDHITRHKMFTISGGVVNLQDSKIAINDGKHLLKIADTALKSAKENGKNLIVTANDEVITSAMDKITKRNTAKSAS